MSGPTPSYPRLSARTRRFTLGEPRSFTVGADGRRVLFLRAVAGDDPRTGLWLLDLDSGEERALVDPAGTTEEDLPAAERARRERVRETATGVVSYAASADAGVVAFPASGRVHVVDVASGEVRSLDTAGDAFDPRPSPDGRLVAYVSGNDVRLVGADGDADRLLVGAESDTVSWGRAEFVAAEEMDRTRGSWWSPAGDALLVARVDEAPVATWWIADPAHPGSAPQAVRYPAAGTANADVSLWLVRLDGSRAQVAWDAAAFPYLARVHWSTGGPPLLAVQSRDQRTVVYLTVDAATGATTEVARDSDPTWVELFAGSPSWWDGRLVRIADVDGARRLLVGDEPVTPADVHVHAVAGDGGDGVLVMAGTGGIGETAVLSCAPGRPPRPVTSSPGVHAAVAAAGTVVVTAAALDRDGNATTVTAADGSSYDVVSRSVPFPLTPSPRLQRLTERGLHTGLVLPRDHVAGTRLPVLMDPYGGPHAARVVASRRAWLEPQWWADQGFAVLVVDGAGTPGRSPAFEREVAGDLATPVLDDQVAALQAAAALEPDLDLARVGIRGWSFGGYLAALAVLRRPDVFHAAVAGAPVTDWSLYDTHYTERYLGTDATAPSYRRSSLLDDAAGLARPLMLVHGLADDNVVAAHTLRLSQLLTQHGRPHTVLPLTGVTHMTPQEEVAENLLLLQRDFLRRELSA